MPFYEYTEVVVKMIAGLPLSYKTQIIDKLVQLNINAMQCSEQEMKQKLLAKQASQA